MPRRVLVTGANRGMGLEWARQTLARGARVWAGARHPEAADDLHRLRDEHPDRLAIVALDVADADSVEAALRRVEHEAEGLDLLVNNAAILPDTPAGKELGKLDADTLLQTLRVNAVAPLLLAQRSLPLLRRGQDPVVVSISSGWGSVSRAGAGWPYAYCASKAALDMAMRIFAGDVREEGITSVLFDPGWVRTEMGGVGASLSPEQSVREMLAVVDGMGPEDTGRFLNRRGEDQPW